MVALGSGRRPPAKTLIGRGRFDWALARAVAAGASGRGISGPLLAPTGHALLVSRQMEASRSAKAWSGRCSHCWRPPSGWRLRNSHRSWRAATPWLLRPLAPCPARYPSRWGTRRPRLPLRRPLPHTRGALRIVLGRSSVRRDQKLAGAARPAAGAGGRRRFWICSAQGLSRPSNRKQHAFRNRP